jgi:O-methyltransferase
MKDLLRKALRGLGIGLARTPPWARALGPAVDGEAEILARVRPFTMTSDERIAALVRAAASVVDRGIPGDLAECGVWRGGSMMAAALTLLARGDTSRHLYLYDTFQGMSEPTDRDVSFDGQSARTQLQQAERGTGIWCEAGLADVRENLRSTGYPAEKLHFVEGKVEDTIPGVLPGPLAILRLDTDWYESTKHELAHLYPLLAPGGVLIIDDYGHWVGAKQAVDEYFAARGEQVRLDEIDYTGRLMIRGADRPRT